MSNPIVVTPTRTEFWERDGQTAAVEVGRLDSGSNTQVVVVSLELLRQMLHDLGFAMQPQSAEVD